MTKGFLLKWEGDESCKVYLNSAFLIDINHDAHGWRGMDQIEALIRSISDILGLEVVEVDSP